MIARIAMVVYFGLVAVGALFGLVIHPLILGVVAAVASIALALGK